MLHGTPASPRGRGRGEGSWTSERQSASTSSSGGCPRSSPRSSGTARSPRLLSTTWHVNGRSSGPIACLGDSLRRSLAFSNEKAKGRQPGDNAQTEASNQAGRVPSGVRAVGSSASPSAGERVVVLGAIERQLPQQPLVETRHRKPLRPNPIAPWQLSVEDLRVFYEVGAEANGPVRILAIGQKNGNILTIGGEEVQL